MCLKYNTIVPRDLYRTPLPATMYSAAFNNFENLVGSADPKTGTYSFRHTFGTVQANGLFGPKCNLTMSYSLLSTMGSHNTTGLGKGWSFRIGSYGRTSNLLSVCSGSTYVVLSANDSKPWKLSQKLHSMKVTQENAGNEIHVCHKNGDTEIMQVDPSSGDAHISHFKSANGRYLRFGYQQQFGYKRLMAIYDSESNTNPLATITYDDNNGRVTIVTYPGTPDSSETILNISSGGLLDQMVLPGQKRIRFCYTPYDFHNGTILYPVTEVSYPTGATEKMEYGEKLYLPTNGPIPYTPAISKHTKIVATDQPLIVSTFSYGQDGDDRNHWGYGSGIIWADNMDGLFNYPSTYHYSSKLTNGSKVTTFTYNKFHQTLSRVETNGNDSNKIITEYEYFSDEEKVLDEQLTTYELTKKEIMRYQRSSEVSQDFVRSYEYDDWGNVTRETGPSGVYTVKEYYPPEGGDGCPAHPFGMSVYLKERTHHPIDGSQSKTFSYTYQSIPSLGRGSAIVPLNASYGSSTKLYTYFDSSDPRTQGMPQSHTVTVGNKATVKTCSYDFHDNTVVVTDTVTGHDGASLSTSKELSFWTGLTQRETDENGVVKAYTHDSTGRLISETVGVGTDYEVTTTYSYIDNPVDPSGTQHIGVNIVQETDIGATVHKYYDGEHRELVAYQKDKHDVLRKLSQNRYDSLGRKVSTSHLDYIISESDGSVKKTMSETVTYVYDTWGYKSEIGHSNGPIEISFRDPINLRTTRQVVLRDGAGNVTDTLNSVVTTQDLFGNPISKEVLTKTGESYSTTHITYDGFGRKRAVRAPTDETAIITSYDEFDRPVEFKHYDGTVFQVSYADFVSEPLVSNISAPTLNVTLAQRDYDSFSRVTRRRVGGVETQFEYSRGFHRPSRQVNARGNTTLFDYIPELEMQTSRVATFANNVPNGAWDDSSKVSESLFSYSKERNTTLGRILSASSSTSQYSYSYDTAGHIKETTQTVGKHSQTVTDLKSSVAGKSVSVQIGNRIVSFEYDDSGRVVSTMDSDIKTELSADDFGRLSSKVVKHYNSTTDSYDLVQSTATTYDEHSREILRTITVAKTSRTLSIQSAYDNEDKLVQRVTSVDNGDSLTESFTYDSKRRLLSYTASNFKTNAMLPRNKNGKPFVSKSFTLDGLDNILSIVTAFPNGESDMATFTYDATHKQKLVEVSHSLTTGDNAYPPSLTLQYDADGNLTSYNNSNMSYTVSGRLSTKNQTNYSYDPYDNLVQTNDTVRMYSGQLVVQEVNDNSTTDFIRCGGIPIGEVQNGQVKFYGVDQKMSVILVTDATSTVFMNYSPYGNGDNGARIGINGELRDVNDRSTYPMGNGTRVYMPSLCGFSSADTFSPFLCGSINPFKYSGLNPISAIDPSGHISLLSIFGAIVAVVALIAVPFTGGSSIGVALGAIAGVAGVVSAGLNIGAEVAAEHGNKKLAKDLGIASLTFGIAGAALSIGQVATDVAMTAKAAMAAKSIPTAEAFGDIDSVVTTGFTKRFAIARRSTILSEDENKFFVVKVREGSRSSSFKMITQQKIIEKKIGPLFLRTVKTPLRMFRGGEYAGVMNTLSKAGQISKLTTVGLLGSPTISIVRYAERLDTVTDNNTKQGGDDEEHTTDDAEGHDEGSEPIVNASLSSANGLPDMKKVKGAEEMLFT